VPIQRLTVLAILLIGAVALAGCGSASGDLTPTPATVAEVATALAMQRAAQDEAAPTEQGAEPADEPTSTPAPAADTPPETASESACIDCHTDAETLKVLAVEEVTESLSEGEG